VDIYVNINLLNRQATSSTVVG